MLFNQPAHTRMLTDHLGQCCINLKIGLGRLSTAHKKKIKNEREESNIRNFDTCNPHGELNFPTRCRLEHYISTCAGIFIIAYHKHLPVRHFV